MIIGFKQMVYERCCAIVDERLTQLRGVLDDLILSAANETKSTAGDKYETARAMLHIEQDNVRRQIAEAQAQKAVLDSLDVNAVHQIVGPGSLVKAAAGLYFISVGLGKIWVDDVQVIALSAQSPLGAKMLRLAAGDQLLMNGKELRIEEVA